MRIKTIRDKYIAMAAAAVSAALTAVTFVTDRMIFTFPEKTGDAYKIAVTDYAVCKVLAFLALFAFIYGIGALLFSKSDYAAGLLEVIKCALPYLPILLVILVIKLPEGFLTNDEYSIYADATQLVHDTWFNYMTVYYYIVSLMLIPVKYAPIIIKIIIEFFTVGYTVYRAKGYFGKKAGMIMYVLFLLYPVIAYTTSAHRLPVYFLLYLGLFVKIIFDRAEHKELTVSGAAFILIAGTILTQWRTEGIYLLVLVPVLMFMAYPKLRNKKAFAAVIASYLIIQYVISVPQNGATSSGLDSAANDRMKPFYAYTITNMMRNGLDRQANAEDLAIVDKYLSIESIDNINEYYADINYEDVLILYKEGFTGVREDAGYTQYVDFTDALKRIFVNNPQVFAKTRWGAFCYAALPYRITFSGYGARQLISFALSIVKSFAYNLFIPVIFAAGALIYCLVKRKWFGLFIFGGLAAHFAIVFVLAPASYFKYYFPVYIMSYFFMISLVIFLIFGRKAKREDINGLI